MRFQRNCAGTAGRRAYPQREVRDSSAATAATPAVEVRSTSAPSRTETAPAATNAATSSSDSPPSGPTTTTMRPAGTSTAARDAVAASCSTTARSASAAKAATSAVEASSATLGNHERRACLAASRAVARHLASDFAARSPFQTATLRDAAHGTTRATPISVSTSTASSPRSPLGSACTTTTSGAGGSTDHIVSTVSVKTRLPVVATGPSTDVPAPSVRTTRSPTRSRRTATAWWASSPSTVTSAPSPTPASEGTRCTGRDIGVGSVLVERVAEPAEHALVAGAHLAGRLLLTTDGRELGQQLLLARVEVARRLDDDGDDQVAPAAAQPGHAPAAEHLLGAGLGAGPDVEVDAGLDLARRVL